MKHARLSILLLATFVMVFAIGCGPDKSVEMPSKVEAPPQTAPKSGLGAAPSLQGKKPPP